MKKKKRKEKKWKFITYLNLSVDIIMNFPLGAGKIISLEVLGINSLESSLKYSAYRIKNKNL